MKNFLLSILLAVSAVVLPVHKVHARGGGGCLEHGTVVLTPVGAKPVETLKAGDTILSVTGGRSAQSEVRAVTEVQPDSFCEIICGDKTLRVTSDHPVEIAPGIFRTASSLKARDFILVSDGTTTASASIDSVSTRKSGKSALNLLVMPGGTYIAGGIVVHNKGCFLPDTPVRKADGTETPISCVKEGDKLLAFTPDGAIVTASVLEIIVHEVDEYLLVKTAKMALRVTIKHPFYTGKGTFKTVEALKVGDEIFAFDGKGLSAQKIESIERVLEKTKVYNIQTDAPNTFFANGIAVHNKGCLEEGTPILTPSGETAVEKLGAGDTVLVPCRGNLVPAKILAVTRVQPGSYIEIRSGSLKLRLTAEHPVETGAGVFKRASSLKAGDAISVLEGKESRRAIIDSISTADAGRPAYNLLVMPGGAYIAAGIVVHNKGCFLPDTPVRRADGSEMPIRCVKEGDQLLAFTPDGEIVTATVQNVVVHDVDEYLLVRTAKMALKVTAEHPFYTGNGTFKTLEALKTGDSIYTFDGKGLSRQEILGIEKVVARTKVFNLQTDDPNTFFANGIAVHNKGCLEEGTPILTPSGETAVERLGAGDKVFVPCNGDLVPAEIREVTRVQPTTYLEIRSGSLRLRLTDEHPVETGSGVFKRACSLKAGDTISVLEGRESRRATIDSISTADADKPAYNLLVMPGGTYVAGGIVVHNKGCFLPDTPIRKADGTEVSISEIRAGDSVMAFTDDGVIVTARVQKIITHDVREYLAVRTDKMLLHVTAEHPFYVGNGTFKTVETLKAGDCIYAFDGNGLSGQKIRGIRKISTRTRVYNLQTDDPNTFFANGIAVHNKGGSHGSSGGGDGSPWPAFIFMGIVIIIMIAAHRSGKKNADLDYVYPPSKVAKKADKTMKLLEFLAKQDALMSPGNLRDVARLTFTKLQQCWRQRDYTEMKLLMMPDLFAEHNLQIQGMIRNHEINMIDDLKIDRMDLVNVRYTLKENQREFTALITATAKDYYIDDRTSKMVRGDTAPAQFQEFWTFQYLDKVWRLREIEQTRESDALKEENFFEQFTDTGVEQIYGETAGKEGPAGPWLEKDVEAKDTKIERMLNFLVQTDKIWNRQAMIETTRKTFIEMMTAWEAGEISAVPTAGMFPELAANMKERIAWNRAQNVKLEFRNLCVRKVELLLVRNFADNTKDEFVARVRAHAQKVMMQHSYVRSRDEDVTPFEQYLTFGRLENTWKLKEVSLHADASGLVKQENLDQDSSVQQLHWYYEHRRAM